MNNGTVAAALSTGPQQQTKVIWFQQALEFDCRRKLLNTVRRLSNPFQLQESTGKRSM